MAKRLIFFATSDMDKYMGCLPNTLSTIDCSGCTMDELFVGSFDIGVPKGISLGVIFILHNAKII